MLLDVRRSLRRFPPGEQIFRLAVSRLRLSVPLHLPSCDDACWIRVFFSPATEAYMQKEPCSQPLKWKPSLWILCAQRWQVREATLASLSALVP